MKKKLIIFLVLLSAQIGFAQEQTDDAAGEITPVVQVEQPKKKFHFSLFKKKENEKEVDLAHEASVIEPDEKTMKELEKARKQSLKKAKKEAKKAKKEKQKKL